MSENEHLVRQFCRRVALWYFARRAVAAVTLWIFLWGTAVLVLRTTLGTSLAPLYWGALGIPVALAAAVWSVRRELPDRAAVRALLDHHSGCGGLLMAGAERDLGSWQRSLPALELPRLRWHAARPLGLLAVAIGYVLVGFLLPAQVTALAMSTPLDVSRDADRLTEQVRVLKEEKILEPERADSFQKKLDQVRKQAAGNDPAKTLEAIDHLKEMVRQAARKAAEAAAQKSNILDQVSAAAEAIQEAAPNLDSATTTELVAELSKMAKKSAAESEEFQESLDADLKAALESGKLTKEQLEKLAAAAKAGKGDARKLAQKLYDAKLIDADQLKECQGKGECDAKGLAEFLKKNGAKEGLKEGIAQLPGRGGVNEGPGTSGLQFGDPSDSSGTKFREEVLPPTDVAKIKESQVVGVSGSTPQRDPKAGPPMSGALTGSSAGGGSANTPAVLPQHRGPVGRYFDRPAK